MKRGAYRRCVLAIFRSQGPMLSDAELGWYARVALALNPATAKKTRRQLTKAKEIQFARRVRITASGRCQKLWEIAPRNV